MYLLYLRQAKAPGHRVRVVQDDLVLLIAQYVVTQYVREVLVDGGVDHVELVDECVLEPVSEALAHQHHQADAREAVQRIRPGSARLRQRHDEDEHEEEEGLEALGDVRASQLEEIVAVELLKYESLHFSEVV